MEGFLGRFFLLLNGSRVSNPVALSELSFDFDSIDERIPATLFVRVVSTAELQVMRLTWNVVMCKNREMFPKKLVILFVGRRGSLMVRKRVVDFWFLITFLLPFFCALFRIEVLVRLTRSSAEQEEEGKVD